MHGGAAGSGAPRDNKNAQTCGLYTISQRRKLNELVRESRKLILKIE
jgi:glucans biosynthesis protein